MNGMKKHLLRATALVGLLTVVLAWAVYRYFDRFVPLQASDEGAQIDRLLRLEFVLIAFFFALVVGFTLYAVFAFRSRPEEPGDGAPIHGWTPLELGWTIIPLLIVVWLGWKGYQDYIRIRPFSFAPREGLLVQVEAFQFGWSFRYPQYQVTSSTLVLPVDTKVRFEIRSRDVIHSFWVPEFRVKEDAVPGRVTYTFITPKRTGDFTVRCAELCGAGHAFMRAPVKVVTQEEFQTWVQQQMAQNLSPEEKGYRLVKQFCLSCHTLDGTRKVGPTFQGIFGRETTLQDGSTVVVDEAYIRESVRNPQAKIVAGFPPAMPPFPEDRLSDEDLDAIIAFLKAFTEGTFQIPEE